MKHEKAFWRGFWEGMNPAFQLAWLLYALGDGVMRLMNCWHPLGRLYPVYKKLMTWSYTVQDKFNVSGPWNHVSRDH